MRSLSLGLLLACLGFGLAPSVAKAGTIFNVSATVGNIQGGGSAGAPTGLALLGILTIDTVSGTLTGGSLQLGSNPNLFTTFFGCPASCTFYANTGFADFGLLDLIGNANTLVGYAGGALKSDSYIDVASVAYDLRGTVSTTSTTAATPEPASYSIILLGLGGLYLAKRRLRA